MASTCCPSNWDKLPEELEEEVLRLLPFSSRIGYRVVCKHWNSIITSSYLNRICHDQTSNLVPILVPRHGIESCRESIHPYKASNGSWSSFSLSFLQSVAQNEPLHLIVSSGGLLCFKIVNRRHIIICNPCSKGWRQLELPSDSDEVTCENTYSSQTLTGLVVDEKLGSYKLVVASLSSKRTMVNDSATRHWRRGRDVPNGQRFGNSRALTCNGSLYCLVMDDSGLEEEELMWKLVKYDVKHDKWTQVVIMEKEYWLQSKLIHEKKHDLVEHWGGVLLVTRVTYLTDTDQLDGATFFRVLFESTTDSTMLLRMAHCGLRETKKSKQWTLDGFLVGRGKFIYCIDLRGCNRNVVKVKAMKVRIDMKSTELIRNPLFLSTFLSWQSEIQMEIVLFEPSLIAMV